MDLLVEWSHGTKNVVSSSEIVCLNPQETIKTGTAIKMCYNKKWYKGTVLAIEEPTIDYESSSSDDFPLSEIMPLSKKFKCSDTINTFEGEKKEKKHVQDDEKTKTQSEIKEHNESKSKKYKDDPETGSDTNADDTDSDPHFTTPCEYIDCFKDAIQTCKNCNSLLCHKHLSEQPNSCESHGKKKKQALKKKQNKITHQVIQKHVEVEPYLQTCEVGSCAEEVFSSCHRCTILLCYPHFIEDIDECKDHGKSTINQAGMEHTQDHQPEDYTVEGAERETVQIKKKKVNIRTDTKEKRNKGLEYSSPGTNKTVPKRTVKERCNSGACTKGGRMCANIDDDTRQYVMSQYYKLGNLTDQRQYIMRHLETTKTKQKTTNTVSRRQNSLTYYLTCQGSRLNVCKKFFLNTLSISERTVRTAISKVDDSGILESEKRGGRNEKVLATDKLKKTSVEVHISRFPRMESHYCRAESTREYLHSDLNIKKMYDLYKAEVSEGEEFASLSTYKKIFKSLNLSFHHPKKDQCSLCFTYREGDDSVKAKLHDKYTAHIEQKTKVREIKKILKEAAQKPDSKAFCGHFDMQQVFHLPITNESAVFYKKRFNVFNLTVYDLANTDCTCYTWNESESKRGSCEISTAVYNALKMKDDEGFVRADLFSDGCGGQNKNSIVASMLLYTIAHSNNLKEISLKFFESYHGQSEGDSAHSTINTAVKQAGNIYVPSQLVPIFKLARRNKPYKVVELQYGDFLDFKEFSKDLHILSVRESVGSCEKDVKWPEMMELRVIKRLPETLFYKTSHIDPSYKKIQLKRLKKDIREYTVSKLNQTQLKIAPDKYLDLVSLCNGPTPVIRMPEHQLFYKNLDY